MAKFYNSSIVSFDESASLNGSEITLDVTTVDCAIDGDSFAPPEIGTPSLFEYDGHQFYGLLDRYSRSNSANGFPQYSIQLSNGLFLLNGTQLIINDYYGSTNSVPNLINVFGYLENSGGYGAAGINDAGISWKSVANALHVIANYSGVTPYGGCIRHKGYKYGIDISGLPNIPTYYRINSDSTSILEFIEEVCEAGGHDFFIKLDYLSPAEQSSTGLDGRYKVYTINRSGEANSGEIQNYIDSATCVTSTDIGQELRKGVTSKLVVGANVDRVWVVETATSGGISGGITQAEYLGYNVLPYFGTNTEGNYIVGYTYEDQPDEYYFDIDIRDINHPLLGDTYTTSYGELRAAKAGKEAWERFLGERSCNKYLPLPEASCGVGSVTARPFVTPVPTGTPRITAFDMDPGGDYPPTSQYIYQGVPKYSYWESHRLQQANQVPSGFDMQNYFIFASSGTAQDSYSASACAVNSEVNGTGKFFYNLYYPSSNTLNPYFGRAQDIRTVSSYIVPYARMWESTVYRLSQYATSGANDLGFYQSMYTAFKSNLGVDAYASAVMNFYNSDLTNRFKFIEGYYQEKANKLFRRLKDLADNYYGKRYIVTIPSMLAAVEPESTKIRVSQEPTDAGYIDESEWATAYSAGILPEVSGLNILLSPEEKFYPFVKFSNAITYSGSQPVGAPYDYSSIGQSDKVLGSPYVSGTLTYLDLWVKTSVWDKIVYADNTTLLSPRVVVELPGQVTYDPVGNYGSIQALYTNITGIARGSGGAFIEDTGFDNTAISKIVNTPGIDELKYHNANISVTPDIFAVPLKSNLLTYGPWYLAGANGPVVYERNQDLAPWNYGGYTGMDAAGFARVTDGVTSQTFDETGSVTVAGTPSLDIASQLISGGPYITDISVSVGSNGITTQYTFQSWSSQRRLSKLTNFNGERIKRLNQRSRDLRRSFREGLKNNLWKNPLEFFNDIKNKFVNLEDYSARDNSNSSHKILMGDVNNVVIQPNYNAGSQIADDYQNKAVMSLDGVFRPYSLWENDTLPAFTMPGDSGAPNTSLDLNPLKLGHDISILTNSSGGEMTSFGANGKNIEVEVNESGVPDYRGMALKGPIVINGWGRDINGDPVPLYVDDNGDPILDSGGNKQWKPDYLMNPRSWPVGPVELPWDPVRGVWSAAASPFYMGVVKDDISNPSDMLNPSTGQAWRYVPNTANNGSGEVTSLDDCYLYDSTAGPIDSGTMVYYKLINGQYHIVYMACSEDNVITPLINLYIQSTGA